MQLDSTMHALIAEASAIAEMLKQRETHIVSVVAVCGDRIIPPCGRCREMLVQVDSRNIDCKVILDNNHAVLLRELLPSHWLDVHYDLQKLVLR